jgi:hypothetical protein
VTPARRRETRRQTALALVASAALHGILLLALRGGAPPPAAPGEILVVDLREAPPPAGTAAPPSGVPQGGARAPERAPEEPRPAPRRRGGEVAGAPGAEPEAGPRGRADPDEVRRWLDEHGLARPGGDGVDLEFAPPPGSLDPGAGPGEGGEDEEDLPPGVRAKRRVDEMIAEMKARDLARYPDASWLEMGEALGEGFAPSFDALRDGGSAAGSALGDAVSAYAHSARRYADTGVPFENDPDAPGRANASSDAAARASASGNRDRESLQSGLDALAVAGAGKNTQPWTRSLGARVSVLHDDEGVVVSVRLVETSGNASYDRLVVEQARKTVGRRFSTFARATTEWLYVTDLSVNPPVPTAGVALDANFKPTGVEYPLKRSVRPLRPELVAVRGRDG